MKIMCLSACISAAQSWATDMIGVTFVCLGNICRSPMAEAVFKKMVDDEGLSLSFNVSSFATSDCEEGNPVYPPVSRLLREKGYNFTHTAKTLTLADVKNAQYVLIMDALNLRDIVRLTGGNYGEKIFMLGSFGEYGGDIADPYYTRDFERTYREIYSSCKGLLAYLLTAHAEAIGYDRRH